MIKIFLGVGLLAFLIASCNIDQQQKRRIDKHSLSAQALIGSPNSLVFMNADPPIKVPGAAGIPACIPAYWWARKLRQRIRGAQ